MSKYNPNEFISALNGKIKGKKIANCPYCGGEKFTSTDKFATVIIGDNLGNMELGLSIPSGMLICESCGHMEFFALGSLGLLRKGEDENGK